jgi:hypothetical protein
MIDCYILPDIGDYRVWDFDAVPMLEACGRAAAERVVAQLKADLGLDRLPATVEVNGRRAAGADASYGATSSVQPALAVPAL